MPDATRRGHAVGAGMLLIPLDIGRAAVRALGEAVGCLVLIGLKVVELEDLLSCGQHSPTIPGPASAGSDACNSADWYDDAMFNGLPVRVAIVTVPASRLMNLRSYLLYRGVPKRFVDKCVPLNGQPQKLHEIVSRVGKSYDVDAVKEAVLEFMSPPEVIQGVQ